MTCYICTAAREHKGKARHQIPSHGMSLKSLALDQTMKLQEDDPSNLTAWCPLDHWQSGTGRPQKQLMSSPGQDSGQRAKAPAGGIKLDVSRDLIPTLGCQLETKKRSSRESWRHKETANLTAIQGFSKYLLTLLLTCSPDPLTQAWRHH